MTWNSVWGCRNNCPYCYARTIAKRFWKQRYIEECNYYFKLHPDWVWTGDHLVGLKDFKPTWLESQFDKKFPRKPQRIFIGSMSEIEFWGEDWVKKVIEKTKEYPQHIFQFLTKYPEAYNDWIFPKNCWLGVTITNGTDSYKLDEFRKNKSNILFLSLEPIFNYIPIDCIDFADWIIIGFQTNPFKIIEREIITKIIGQIKEKNIPLFLKDSIYEGYSDLPIIKKFPDGR